MNKSVNTLIMLLLALCTALAVGCAQKKASEEVDAGKVENSVYHNDYFGMSVNIPPDWSVAGQSAKERYTELGESALGFDNNTTRDIQRTREQNTVQLLTVSKYPMGHPVSSNPNIVCLAERVSHMPQIKEGKDYLSVMRKLLEASQLNADCSKDTSSKRIDGVDFDVMRVQISVPGTTVKQQLYATVIKGYALLISISYTTEEEESSLIEILDSVSFN